MKRWVVASALLVFALVIDMREPFGIRLDTTCLLVAYFAIRYGPLRGFILGALSGLYIDALSGGILGPSIFGKALVGILIPYITMAFFKWTPLIGLIIMGGATILDRLISFVISAPLGGATFSLAIFASVLGGVVLNSLFGAFIEPKMDLRHEG